MTEIATEALPEHLQAVAKVVDTDVPRPVDYFSASTTEWVDLPDGVQKIQVKVLSEGERRRYLNQTNRDVRMNARTKDLVMKSAVGDDEKVLLETAVTDWVVFRADSRTGEVQPLRFTPQNLGQALDAWPPAAWRPVVKKIRELNEWLQGDEDNLVELEDEYRELGERIARIKDAAVKD